MSNVVPFRRPDPRRAPAGCDVVTIADDLFMVLEELQSVAERAALMDRPALEVERTVQKLLDAIGTVEAALDCLGEGSTPA